MIEQRDAANGIRVSCGVQDLGNKTDDGQTRAFEAALEKFSRK